MHTQPMKSDLDHAASGIYKLRECFRVCAHDVGGVSVVS